MAHVAALHARIRVDIARAEATLRARETDRFTLVEFGVVQRFVVELVSLQPSVAGVAAPRSCVLLALEALSCLRLEGPCIFHFSARGAGMAGSAT